MVGIYCIEKILSERYYEGFSLINPEWFETVLEERVFNYALSLFRRYAKCPSSLRHSAFAEFNIPDNIWKDYDDNLPFSYYFDTLKKRYMGILYRKIKELKASKEDQAGIESFLESIYKELKSLNEMAETGAAISFLSSDSIAKRTEEEAREHKLNFASGNIIQSGWKSLDETIGGGFTPGEVFVVVARLKMGKTMYLIHSLLHSLQNKKRALLVSMEMDFFAIMRRLLGIYYKNSAFVVGQQFVLKDWLKIREEYESLGFSFDYLNGATIKDIQHLKGLLSNKQYDVIYIDGAYLMNSPHNYRSEWEKVKSVIGDIKNLAMFRRIPVVCSYQFNRAAIGTEDPDVEHIAFSDAIAQAAGAVISITNVKNEPNVKKLSIIANRYGELSKFYVGFDWEQMYFGEKEGYIPVSLPEEGSNKKKVFAPSKERIKKLG